MAEYAEKKVKNPTRHARSGPLTALLVDQDDDLRVYLRRCLEQFGSLFSRILEVSTGSEALSVARASGVDLLICGAHVSQPGTTALFNAVRADPATASIHILLLTDGDEEVNTSPGSAHALADAVLIGPFNAVRFADRLEKLLGSG